MERQIEVGIQKRREQGNEMGGSEIMGSNHMKNSCKPIFFILICWLFDKMGYLKYPLGR